MVHKLLLVIILFFVNPVKAGLFLDLGLGTFVRDWQGCDVDDRRCLSNESPLGVVRAGYQTDKYNMGNIDISVHGYYEHISSYSDTRDNGIDVIIFGLRID